MNTEQSLARYMRHCDLRRSAGRLSIHGWKDYSSTVVDLQTVPLWGLLNAVDQLHTANLVLSELLKAIKTAL